MTFTCLPHVRPAAASYRVCHVYILGIFPFTTAYSDVVLLCFVMTHAYLTHCTRHNQDKSLFLLSFPHPFADPVFVFDLWGNILC